MPPPARPKATKLATTRMGITDTEPTPWVGVVLAGGRSSRMGRDKARLAWRDQSLLALACARLQAAGACKVVVSGDYPEYAGIPDALPALGPLGGLASVVDALPDGVLLLVPVDMPLLTPELLDRLARHQATPCVTYRDHVLPMRLVVDASTRCVACAVIKGRQNMLLFSFMQHPYRQEDGSQETKNGDCQKNSLDSLPHVVVALTCRQKYKEIIN